MVDVTIEDNNTELITAVDACILDAPNCRASREEVASEETTKVLVSIVLTTKVDTFIDVTFPMLNVILDAINDDVLKELVKRVEHDIEDAFALFA